VIRAFREFESGVGKKGEAILALGTTTLLVCVNSFPLGSGASKLFHHGERRHREKLKA